MAASSQSEPAVDGIVEQGEGGGEVPEDGTVTPPPRSRGLDEEITALIQRRKDLRRESRRIPENHRECSYTVLPVAFN